MRIVLVDANRAFRRDLARYLSMLDAAYQVVGEASTARASLRYIAMLRPDIVIADVDLPDCNGLRAMRQALHRWPDIAILMIGNHPQTDYRQATMRAGALDYINKLELIHALPPALAVVACRPRSPALVPVGPGRAGPG